MNSSLSATVYKILFMLFFLMATTSDYAQQTPLPKAKTDSFWERVDFGGGLGLSISNNYTDILIAPSAIYNFNDYFALGTGLQYSNLKQKNYYSSNLFGGSLIGLFNPIEEAQISVELEQAHVSTKYEDLGGNLTRKYWNTALYIGAGYRQDNITVGGRVNVLFDRDKDLYGSAFMPFIRVFF